MWDLHGRGDAGVVRGGSSGDWRLLGPLRRAKVLQEEPPGVSRVSAGQGWAAVPGGVRAGWAHAHITELCDAVPWLQERERRARNASVTVPPVEFVHGFLLCLRLFG